MPETHPADLDIEGRPIGPMTAAEFKVVREYLGLSGDWLATHLDVNPRTVRAWESGKYPVPEGVRLQMEALEAETARGVTLAIDACNDMRDPGILTYRSDTDYRRHHPELNWPASWHRAVVARVAQEVIGLRIEYWEPDEQ